MHITIAGKLGSGKSTVCSILKNRYGYEIYSTGSIQRALASEMGITTLEMNEVMNKDIKYDSLIDDAVSRLSRKNKDKTIVFDSRMAWKFAENSFNVYLTIDPQEAANRVIQTRNNSVESYSSITEAKNMLIKRSNVENERFKKIYNVDNFDYRNYNLVLDTTYISAEMACDIIYKHFIDNKGEKDTKIFLSPKCLYPIKNYASVRVQSEEKKVISKINCTTRILILPFEGYNYIIFGHDNWFAAIIENKDLVEVSLADIKEFPSLYSSIISRGAVPGIDKTALNEFEKAGNFKYLSYPEPLR